jgi:hypothetical protein
MDAGDSFITAMLHRNPDYDYKHGRNVIVEWQGDRLTVKVVNALKRETPKGGSKAIHGFSEGARFRCLKYVAGIKWEDVGESYYVTLTYPDHIDWSEHSTRQSHLSNFQAKLRRHYDRPVAFLWRTEWQTRKSGVCIGLAAPHFHLLVFNCPLLTKTNVWNWWMDCIGEHVYVDVDVEGLYNRERVGLYMAKYAAKQDALLGYVADLDRTVSGGAWGKRYEHLIPRAETKRWVTTLNDKTAAIMREARGYCECEMLGYNDSFTVLGPLAAECGRFMARYTVDGELPNV